MEDDWNFRGHSSPLTDTHTQTQTETQTGRASASARATRSEAFLAEARQTRFADVFEGAIRAAHDPAMLVSELQAMRDGLHGLAVPLEVLGQALTDIRVNGDQLTSRRLRVFCGDLMRTAAAAATPSGAAPSDAIAAEAEATKRRIGGYDG